MQGKADVCCRKGFGKNPSHMGPPGVVLGVGGKEALAVFGFQWLLLLLARKEGDKLLVPPFFLSHE